jgi:hypothetical protein
MPEGAAPSQLWPIGDVLTVRADGAGGYTAVELAPLAVPRWGHAVSVLPGGRLLVTGGLTRRGNTLRALSTAEVLLLEAPPPPVDACIVPSADAGAPPDGAIEADAGTPGDAG